MTKQYIDVFNGDADGLSALVQLRLATPLRSELVTGVKRDINLLKRVNADADTHITVLDLSFEKNVEDIERLLDEGASIEYIDHHKTGELLKHDLLMCHIDLSAETCTSLIVDKQLEGQYREWAITGAFGDNLTAVAQQLGELSGINEPDLVLLQKLGTYLNYNGYGSSIDDLFFHPAELFEKLCEFESPIEFIKHDSETFSILESCYKNDMFIAEQVPLKYETETIAILELPNEKWARRVSGAYSNELTNNSPDKAHAVLIDKGNKSYLVSIRAPLNRRYGADLVANQFPTGGGRKSAAGINDLPFDKLSDFIAEMQQEYKKIV